MAHEHLQRAIALVTNKGGVGKTSISANLAGQLARNRARVLLVDLDPQGSQSVILGFHGDPRDDQGWGTVQAIATGGSLTVLAGIRNGLDVVPGGGKLKTLIALGYTPDVGDPPGGGGGGVLRGCAQRRRGRLRLRHPGLPTQRQNPAGRGPDGRPLRPGPITTDALSWKALEELGPLVKKARTANPELTYLGALIFRSHTTTTRLRGATRVKLAEFGDTVPLFDTFIRDSETYGSDASVKGLLAHEVARASDNVERERLQALRQRSDGHAAPVSALSRTARGVADDYESLLRDVIQRISLHANTTATAGRS